MISIKNISDIGKYEPVKKWRRQIGGSTRSLAIIIIISLIQEHHKNMLKQKFYNCFEGKCLVIIFIFVVNINIFIFHIAELTRDDLILSCAGEQQLWWQLGGAAAAGASCCCHISTGAGVSVSRHISPSAQLLRTHRPDTQREIFYTIHFSVQCRNSPHSLATTNINY